MVCRDFSDLVEGGSSSLYFGDDLFGGFHFLGDIPFGINQRLFAHPALGNFVFMRVSHLDVVAEYPIIADFQRRDFRLFAQNRLQRCQILPSVPDRIDQFVQLIRITILDNPTLGKRQRRIIDNRLGE